MNKIIKTVGMVLYIVFALLSLISIFIGVGEVSENLDGWHNFSSIHSFLFVLICIMFVLGAVFNINSIHKNVILQSNIIVGILLFICPLIINLIANSLQGNVDSDFQYLILRNFQGFDKTYLLMLILGVLSFISMILGKMQSQDNSSKYEN